MARLDRRLGLAGRRRRQDVGDRRRLAQGRRRHPRPPSGSGSGQESDHRGLPVGRRRRSDHHCLGQTRPRPGVAGALGRSSGPGGGSRGRARHRDPVHEDTHHQLSGDARVRNRCGVALSADGACGPGGGNRGDARGGAGSRTAGRQRDRAIHGEDGHCGGHQIPGEACRLQHGPRRGTGRGDSGVSGRGGHSRQDGLEARRHHRLFRWRRGCVRWACRWVAGQRCRESSLARRTLGRRVQGRGRRCGRGRGRCRGRAGGRQSVQRGELESARLG
ncbi:hypothetical protein SAMN04244553_2571 [Nocardia amikacinitolerans]|uniref:Uncharacterized protein n=1 Tax=Nocardia amikacinitolerans TaxID=756689 RepID=A0A285L7R5_9NOCA|nr:hypothetical protein SAMN04244553_2571 [Nocardia amikacinitolerans]